MKITTKGDFLSYQSLKKKNTNEDFYLSKVLTDSDEMITVYSEYEPIFVRGDHVDVELNIDLQKNNIYASFLI